MAVALCDADADGHLTRALTAGWEATAGNRWKDPVEDHPRLRRGHPDHQNRELVATQAGREIALPEMATDDSCHVDQHAIANLVAQTVVDLLEVVNVDQSHGVGGARPSAEGGMALQKLLEVSTIRQVCKLVG
jgi:hypothetical protein